MAGQIASSSIKRLSRVVEAGNVARFDVAVRLLEDVQDSVYSTSPSRTYFWLNIGIKIKLLLNCLQCGTSFDIFWPILNKYLPRTNHSKTEDADIMAGFRRFILQLAMSGEVRAEFFKTYYEPRFGDGFMFSLCQLLKTYQQEVSHSGPGAPVCDLQRHIKKLHSNYSEIADIHSAIKRYVEYKKSQSKTSVEQQQILESAQYIEVPNVNSTKKVSLPTKRTIKNGTLPTNTPIKNVTLPTDRVRKQLFQTEQFQNIADNLRVETELETNISEDANIAFEETHKSGSRTPAVESQEVNADAGRTCLNPTKNNDDSGVFSPIMFYGQFVQPDRNKKKRDCNKVQKFCEGSVCSQTNAKYMKKKILRPRKRKLVDKNGRISVKGLKATEKKDTSGRVLRSHIKDTVKEHEKTNTCFTRITEDDLAIRYNQVDDDQDISEFSGVDDCVRSSEGSTPTDWEDRMNINLTVEMNEESCLLGDGSQQFYAEVMAEVGTNDEYHPHHLYKGPSPTEYQLNNTANNCVHYISARGDKHVTDWNTELIPPSDGEDSDVELDQLFGNVDCVFKDNLMPPPEPDIARFLNN